MSDIGQIEGFTIVTQPAGAPLSGYHDRAPLVIAPSERERWLTAGADVVDLIGPESANAFDVTPVSKDEEATWTGGPMMREGRALAILPALPRERVAVGVAMATVGAILGYVANGAVQAFTAGGLVGWGVTLVISNLLKLRREALAASSVGRRIP